MRHHPALPQEDDMPNLTHPETYYDAKRALLAKAGPVEQRGSYELRKVIPAVLDALGWVVEPALDDKGKAVKVWSLDVRQVLSSDVLSSWQDAGRAAAKARGSQYHPSWTAYVVAPNKSAAIDLAYGTDRTRWLRPRT